MRVQFYKHNIGKKEISDCNKVLRSVFLTTGDWVRLFEDQLANYTNNKYSIGLSNATDALFLSLKYFNIGPGDEVITTPMSFIATANTIEHCGAKPVFVDVEPNTGNIDISKLERVITRKTKAIVVVHLYGQMCDMKALSHIKKKHKLKIIEDSAHCIEGEREGIKPGNIGDIACYSFYATKNITSGEGGAITTNDRKIYEWFLRARLHGMSTNAADRYTKKYSHYDMEFLGYKANMTNIEAALLLNQLKNIDKLRSGKEKISRIYNKGFSKNKNIKTPEVLKKSTHARYIYTIWVDPKKRDMYLNKIQDAGVGVAVNFRTIHLMSFYKKKYNYKEGDFPLAEKIGNSTITLPLYPSLKSQEVQYVIKTVNKICT